MVKMLKFGDKSKKSPSDIKGDVKACLKKYRAQFEKNVKEEERAYHGAIWENTDGKKPYENEIFQIIEQEVPILTDSFPAPTVEIKDPAYEQQAKNLGKAIEYVQEKNDLPLMLPDVVRNSLVNGVGYIHVYYDPNADNGNGRIIHEIIHWNKYYQSGETSKPDNANKARIELSRTRDWLMLTYPKFKDKLKDAKGNSSDLGESDNPYETKDIGYGPAPKRPPKPYEDEDTLELVKTFKRDWSTTSIPEEETDKEIEEEREALFNNESPDVAKWQNHKAHIESHEQELVELYGEFGLTPDQGIDAVFDMVEQIDAESPESGAGDILLKIKLLELHIDAHKELAKENPSGQKLKYKNGLRCIESVNDIILYDGESKDDHCEIPIAPFYCYSNGTPYAYSEIRNLIDLQRMAAIMTYKEYKGLQKTANPAKEYNEEEGLTERNISNEDGALYGVKDRSSWAIRNIAPGQINPQVTAFSAERSVKMGKISGVNEATSGEMKDPGASGYAISKLQNQAVGRIRLKDRQNQHYSIKRLGKLDAALILQYWTEERTLKLEGGGDDIQPIIFNPLEMEDLDYEIKISSGSMSGVDKDMFNSFMGRLLEGGLITLTDFLQVADLPKMDKLKDLVSERENKDAEIEQLAQELMMMKAQFAPDTLSEEEIKALEQMQPNQAVNNDQAAAMGAV